MIRFACRCTHVFSMPDDQAGLSVQCPKCGLLVDVPGAGEVGSINPDGTYRLDREPTDKPDENVDLLKLIYYPSRQLPDGTEIDLRGPIEPVPLHNEAPPDTTVRERPKYDPESGELIQPLKVGEDTPVPRGAPGSIPEAQRVIDYNVTREALESVPHGLRVNAALCLPVNLIVMLLVLGAHVIFTLLLMAAAYFALLAPFPLAVAMFIASTFTIALEEIGPAEKDDLPRPLRNVQLWEDYFAPAMRAFLAIFICYWPGFLVLILNYDAAMRHAPLPFPTAGRWLLGSYFLGSFFLPAVFLTICTSGTLLNLRPDRVVQLIGRMGWRYALLVAEWMLGSALYLAGAVLLFVGWFVGPQVSWLVGPYVTFPLLITGIYFCFAFCWHLGLHYRMHWQQYPWIAQTHEHRTISIRRPTLHPKIAAADENAARRARSRQQIR